MRLIDADALKKAFYNQECWNFVIGSIIDNAPELGYEDGILSVENATRKAIELEEAYNNGWSDGFSEGENERPKGEWKHEIIGDKSCVLCSICNLHFDNESNFCPNCGANMKGGAV